LVKKMYCFAEGDTLLDEGDTLLDEGDALLDES
jgi:hypothetical protein